MKIFYGYIINDVANMASKPSNTEIKKSNYLEINTDIKLDEISTPIDTDDKKSHQFISVPNRIELIKVKHNTSSVYSVNDIYEKFTNIIDGEKYNTYVTSDSNPWSENDDVEYIYKEINN